MSNILPIELTSNEKESLSYIEYLRDSLDSQFGLKYNLLSKSERQSVLYNHINTNGSIFMNTVFKKDMSKCWTIIDDPIKKD